MLEGNLNEYVKGGLGLELVRESAYTLLGYQNRLDLVERLYDYEEKLNVIHGFSILTMPYFFAFRVNDELAAWACGVGGGLLIASAVRNLARNYRSKRKKKS